MGIRFELFDRFLDSFSVDRQVRKYIQLKINRDILMHDPKRPDRVLLWHRLPSLSPEVFIVIVSSLAMTFSPLCENAPSVRITSCHISSLNIWVRLLLCFLWNEGGWWGGRISTVLNSLMQFNNATYSFHVSLGSSTCEIAEACPARATRRSSGGVTPKRQMWEGERN